MNASVSVSKDLQYIVTVRRGVIGTAVLCGTGFRLARVMLRGGDMVQRIAFLGYSCV